MHIAFMALIKKTPWRRGCGETQTPHRVGAMDVAGVFRVGTKGRSQNHKGMYSFVQSPITLDQGNWPNSSGSKEKSRKLKED